jgi:hypothetical protein
MRRDDPGNGFLHLLPRGTTITLSIARSMAHRNDCNIYNLFCNLSQILGVLSWWGLLFCLCFLGTGRYLVKLIVFLLGFSRYAAAIERNPEDYDALYNWALVLQV